MRILIPLAALSCLAVPVAAHDFWLQPQRFWIGTGATVPIAILVGHGADRAPWGVPASRILLLRDVGPAGVVDHLPAARARAVAAIPAMRFASPGTHVVVIQSGHATSDLPAVRFNDYLKEEGLTPALDLRTRTRTTGSAGREIYSRRAKTLVQVGPPGGRQGHVTRPMGMTLEIVPERNPYAPVTQRSATPRAFPIRVLYEGRALAGALVKLTDLQADEKPVATRRTDSRGRTVFDVPRTGTWQFNVVWTKPIEGDARGDYDTTFSSLTFGFPATR